MVKKYYEILKINESASKSEIKQAYIKLAKETHPDRVGNDSKIEEFKKVAEAYEVLGNEYKKGIYDANGDFSLEKYGYDYGEEIEEGDMALKKYTNHIKEMDEAWIHAHWFYGHSNTPGEEPINTYHLMKIENLLKLLNSYYKPRYLAAKNEIERADLIPFWFWDNGSGLSNQTNWQNNFNRALNYLNASRKVLELKVLTESDLNLKPIKGPNETPQIPGEGPGKPIEDVNIEEYNNSFKKENNETVRKFWELRDKIYNKTEDYERFEKANPSLFKQMDAKTNEAERGEFAKIWQKDESDRISEIKRLNESKLEKMREATKLMEKLIEESKNYKPTSNNQSQGTKRKSDDELEIRQAITKKSRTIGDDLHRLIDEAQNLNGYEELENQIKKIDQYQGEEEYNLRQDKIDQLKIRLGNLDQGKFKAGRIKKIEKLLEENETKITDLDEETKNAFTQLKNEQDINKINELENKVSQNVGKQGAASKLDKLLKAAKEIVDNAVKHTTEQVQKVKRDLYNFYYSNNKFNTSALEKGNKQSEVKQMLENLENYQSQNSLNDSKGGISLAQKLALGTTAALVIGLAGVAIWLKNKNKKIEKESE